ncbi:hypothetical protein EVAR_12161_1 [Eumeta japonica]|uniref:Uncharacterized protein n=1 Tax=Eumeta variegata TaxID=151549 RepID=A0A4C1UGT1_EUMVA|nr:hypothetical protein EVAR_12161_1 [Eumeta japonica]
MSNVEDVLEGSLSPLLQGQEAALETLGGFRAALGGEKYTIRGRFETLNFQQKDRATKTCYVRVSEKLDPLQVIERINRFCKAKKQLMKAFIPEDIPDLPLERPIKKKIKPAPIDVPLYSKVDKPELVLLKTHYDIMRELQTKYTGLYNLSKKSSHKLLEKLAQIEDESGKLRTQVVEADLTSVSISPYVVDNVPYNQIIHVATKYNEKIVNVFNEHIKCLDLNITTMDSEEEIARKKIRVELAKLSPHLIPIYGEPSLPTKGLKPFLARHKVSRAFRSRRVHNLLRVEVPTVHYASLVTMDGTVIGEIVDVKKLKNTAGVAFKRGGGSCFVNGVSLRGSKLIIRLAQLELHKIPESVIAEMKAVFGVKHTPGDHQHEGHLADTEDDWAQLPLRNVDANNK